MVTIGVVLAGKDPEQYRLQPHQLQFNRMDALPSAEILVTEKTLGTGSGGTEYSHQVIAFHEFDFATCDGKSQRIVVMGNESQWISGIRRISQ